MFDSDVFGDGILRKVHLVMLVNAFWLDNVPLDSRIQYNLSIKS